MDMKYKEHDSTRRMHDKAPKVPVAILEKRDAEYVKRKADGKSSDFKKIVFTTDWKAP
jgi:hypothetical protein